jgi:hypothetical protein
VELATLEDAVRCVSLIKLSGRFSATVYVAFGACFDLIANGAQSMRILLGAAIRACLNLYSRQCMADEGSCVGKVWSDREENPILKLFPPNDQVYWLVTPPKVPAAQLFGTRDRADDAVRT